MNKEVKVKILKILLVMKDIELSNVEIKMFFEILKRQKEEVYHSSGQAREEICKKLGISQIYYSKIIQKFASVHLLSQLKRGYYEIDKDILYAMSFGSLYLRLKENGEFSVI